MNKREKVEYLIIHHTERNNDFPFFIKLRHKYLRKWDDIGYHYLIGNTRPFTRNGKIYTGRNEEYEGAHTQGHNKNSLGICLIGNFDKNQPSEKQLQALYKLIKEKMQQYNIPPENIKGHNEFSGVKKSCPGKTINMDEIRKIISK